MLSIAEILAAIQGHLPNPWDHRAAPHSSRQGYKGSISLLQFFVIFVYKVLVTEGYAENSQGQSARGSLSSRASLARSLTDWATGFLPGFMGIAIATATHGRLGSSSESPPGFAGGGGRL